MEKKLPELLDARALAEEMGLKIPQAWAIMRQLPVVKPEGVRKTYVRRADVHTYLERCTLGKDRLG